MAILNKKFEKRNTDMLLQGISNNTSVQIKQCFCSKKRDFQTKIS